MKILSCWEPWSSAIAMGYKQIETRGWSTHYRGLLVNHASKGGLSNKDKIYLLRTEEVFTACGISMVELRPGHILSVSTLVDCIPTGSILANGITPGGSHRITKLEFELGDYSAGRYGWVLQDVFRLPDPIPFKARQGLFDAPKEIIKEIERQRRLSA